MVFEIDKSILDLFEAGNHGADDVRGMEYLALGVAEGNHAITATRQILLSLSKNQNFNLRTQSVLIRAYSRIAQDGHFHHKLIAYGKVTAMAQGNPISTIIGKQRILTFPLKWFDSSSKIQPVMLLGENLSDAAVLIKVGEVGSILNDYGYLPIKVVPDHGGGSTISSVLQNNFNQNRLCICIVDSDRACPNGNIGSTATSVQSFKNQTNYPIVHVHESRGRDLENMLPDTFFNSSYSGNVVQRQMTALLQYLTSCADTELRFHIDIEKGITIGQILRHAPGSTEQVYWNQKLQIILNYCGHSSANFPCLATNVCSQLGLNTGCTCVVLSGNPANILDRFCQIYGQVDRYYIIGLLSDPILREEWSLIGAIIASWGYADKTLRV